MLRTPVIFLIFNRPDLTQRVFECIAAQKPRHLLVIADGPRNEEERELCEQTRAVIKVDWPCQLETNFSETNLGCKERVFSGLNWAFEKVEEAIILEDDCLPHPSFFGFCAEMIDKYRDDERVMMITGDRFLPVDNSGVSHYFSRHVHIWGWATWRRAWRLYDVEMKAWQHDKPRVSALLTPSEVQLYAPLFDGAAQGFIDTWDIQWMLTCFVQSGLSVIPNDNLISNIGFRQDATHTKSPNIFAQLPVKAWSEKPDPQCVFPDRLNDALITAMCLSQQGKSSPLRRSLGRVKHSIRQRFALR